MEETGVSGENHFKNIKSAMYNCFLYAAAALCEDPKSPQGGSIQCHQGTSKKECTVTCQPGFKFEYQPSDKYTCSADGTWTPPKTTMPNCIPGKVNVLYYK